jgi:hypothetical protein
MKTFLSLSFEFSLQPHIRTTLTQAQAQARKLSIFITNFCHCFAAAAASSIILEYQGNDSTLVVFWLHTLQLQPWQLQFSLPLPHPVQMPPLPGFVAFFSPAQLTHSQSAHVHILHLHSVQWHEQLQFLDSQWHLHLHFLAI